MVVFLFDDLLSKLTPLLALNCYQMFLLHPCTFIVGMRLK